MPIKKIMQLNISTQVLISLGLGMLVGVCFGELTAFLNAIGRAFILLMQMSVLPCIALSLITGIGQLTYVQCKQLALKAGALLVFSWGIALVAILMMPLAYATNEFSP